MNFESKIRFVLDHIRDGLKENALIAWPAFDTLENREVYLIGRKVNDKVLPVAVILDSVEAAQRYVFK